MSIFAPGKSHLVTGQAMNWQGSLVRSLVFDHAERGYAVIELVDRPNDAPGAERLFTQWCKVRKLDPADHHYDVIAGPFRGVDEIMRASAKRVKGQNAIIFRDLSTRTLPTAPGAAWLGQAEMLAHGLGFAVVTAAWDHSHPAMKPELTGYKSHVVYHVTATERDTLAATPPGIFVSLKKVWPTQEAAMTFCGHSYPTIVVFEGAEAVMQGAQR